MDFKPLTEETWPNIKALFGEQGACGGCWCMYWRLTHKEYENNKGVKNKEKLHALVKKGRPLGVLAFDQDIPVGWCSTSPRRSLVRLKNSRLFKRIDEKPVWSISCLFIKKEYRRKGLSKYIIQAASNFAFNEGATIIEAYPHDIQRENHA